MIVVVSGPGGVGKGTLVDRLVAAHPDLWLSRSWTTRARRPGEPEDAYTFVDRRRFLDRVDRGGFLEWAEFGGELYGTPLPEVPPGRDAVLEIDVQGARQVHEKFPDALLIFIDAPSRQVQADRLRRRGDTPEAVARRVALAEDEAAAARELGARVVINDDLAAAVDEVYDIISSHR